MRPAADRPGRRWHGVTWTMYLAHDVAALVWREGQDDVVVVNPTGMTQRVDPGRP